jgi:tetratricopeptide (TPR) repeat protein
LKHILNIDIPALNEVLLELQKDKLIIEQKDEILVGGEGVLGDKESNTYLLTHDIYSEVTPQKEYDTDVMVELIEYIKEDLKNNLDKAQKTKNLKLLRIFLKNVLQRFYFLSATEFIDNTEYIDIVLNYLNSVDLDIQKTIIPDLERLVLDFYTRESIESIAKLYLFIGDYYEKTGDLHSATDYYNIGCHLLEAQNMDSTQYRVKNGNLYDKMMDELKNEIDNFEIQCAIELASWQWKASKRYEKGIEVRKILVDEFLKNNKPWAAAEIQWLAEVSELNNKLDDAIQYYNEAIKLLETTPHHILNIKYYLKQISLILEKLNRTDEIQNIKSRTNEIDKKIQSLVKPNGIKIHIISGIGDLFPALQIQYKILQEISSKCTIEAAAPSEKVDILITFGTPLTPIIGELTFKYWGTERETINKMLSSSGYWIKKPSCEGDPLLISIGGYTMFDTRREAENFIKNENFQELIKYL